VLNYAGDLVIEAWRSWRRGSRHTHWFARGLTFFSDENNFTNCR